FGAATPTLPARLRGLPGGSELAEGGDLVRLPWAAAEHEHLQPRRPGLDLALGAGSDAYEDALVELDTLAFDVHPARALQREVDLLLAIARVVVLWVVGVLRWHPDHLHAEGGDAELSSGAHEASAEGGLHVLDVLCGVVGHCSLLGSRRAPRRRRPVDWRSARARIRLAVGER